MSLKESIADYLKINEFRDNITKFVEAKIELTKLEIQDKVEKIAVKAIYALVGFILAIVVLIFLSILFALFLNHISESQYLGFVIVGMVYLGVFFFWIFGKNMVEKGIKKIVEKVVDEVALKQEKGK